MIHFTKLLLLLLLLSPASLKVNSIDPSPVDPSSFDFNQCITSNTSPSPQCPPPFYGVNALTTLLAFQQCTDWDLAELAPAVINGGGTYKSVATACADTVVKKDSIFTAPTSQACKEALLSLSTSSDPLLPYIIDIYNDPDKYCTCNSNFGDALPSCTIPSFVAKGMGEVDLATVKTGSCFFGELCGSLNMTCALVATSLQTCLSTDPNESGISQCDLQCDQILIPEPCLSSSNSPSTPSAFSAELLEQLAEYKITCAGAIVVPWEDFNNCAAVNERSEGECKFSVKLASGIVKFGACTNWNLIDIARDFSDGGGVDFENLISDCSSYADGDSLTKCFANLYQQSISNDSDESNPTAKYIKDIYEDTDHYCNCNAELYKTLPDPCTFSGADGNNAIDVGQLKFSSCLIGEFCTELAASCDYLSEQLSECLPGKDQSCGAIKSRCTSDGATLASAASDITIPPGCYSRFTDPVLKELSNYEKVCAASEGRNTPHSGGGGSGGGGSGSGGGGGGEGEDGGGGGVENEIGSALAGATVALAVCAVLGIGFVGMKKIKSARGFGSNDRLITSQQFDSEDDDDDDDDDDDGGEGGSAAGSIGMSSFVSFASLKKSEGGFMRVADGEGNDSTVNDEGREFSIGDGDGEGENANMNVI